MWTSILLLIIFIFCIFNIMNEYSMYLNVNYNNYFIITIFNWVHSYLNVWAMYTYLNLFQFFFHFFYRSLIRLTIHWNYSIILFFYFLNQLYYFLHFQYSSIFSTNTLNLKLNKLINSQFTHFVIDLFYFFYNIWFILIFFSFTSSVYHFILQNKINSNFFL